MTVTVVVVDGYRILTEFLTAINRRANSVKVLRFSTPAKLYSCEPLLQRLAQVLQDMALELGQPIQEQHPKVRQ